MKNWSSQQEAIFTHLAAPAAEAGNLVVRARAGTGKTTTIIEGLARSSAKSAVLCAFNKRIAEELSARISPPAGGKAEAKTLHSIGFSFVRAAFRGVKVDARRGYALAEQASGLDPYTHRETIGLIQKLAGLAKGCLLPEDMGQEELQDLALAFNICSETFSDEQLAEWARLAIAAAGDLSDGRIDFDDMVFLPLALGLARPTYDLVIVDEAQDMNASQIELARRICRPKGRIVVVGDDRQAIYGFRGADSGSIDRLKSELRAIELPLTVTYRCGRAIVEAAAELVPDFQAADSVGPGRISDLHESGLEGAVMPGDFVLSRTNAPLVRVCLGLLRAGKRAMIQGRDIGATLAALVKKVAGTVAGIEDFSNRLTAWHVKENTRLDRLERAGKDVENPRRVVDDQYETIVELAAGLATVAELHNRLAALFAEVEGQAGRPIVCSSVHKAKGLEAEQVFCLAETFKRPGPEEQNIRYVAITRAREHLVWVRPDPK